MVPYASFPYADHVLRLANIDPAAKVVGSDAQVQILIEAAHKLKQLVADMEKNDDLSGYLIYKEEEATKSEAAAPDQSDLVKKYEGKVVQDFVPCFLLAQHEKDKYIEFESFD